MAKIWLEKIGGSPGSPSQPLELGGGQYWRARSLSREAVLFVRVCGFTFQFTGLDQLRQCHAYYDRKLHPTSRLAGPFIGYGDKDHGESERWFERLPLFLREEPKRLKVVAALRRALDLVATPARATRELKLRKRLHLEPTARRAHSRRVTRGKRRPTTGCS
jgi:hypothetical protein